MKEVVSYKQLKCSTFVAQCFPFTVIMFVMCRIRSESQLLNSVVNVGSPAQSMCSADVHGCIT